jgi:hypothetical protein
MTQNNMGYNIPARSKSNINKKGIQYSRLNNKYNKFFLPGQHHPVSAARPEGEGAGYRQL